MIQKSILFLLIIGICMSCVVGLPQNIGTSSLQSLKLSQHNPVEFNSFVNNNRKLTKEINVVTSLSGYPKTAHYREKVKVKFTIKNKGTKPIHNVTISSQELNKNLGTIKPGQSKSVTKILGIYTSLNGGETVYYTDYKGKIHQTAFKEVYVKIVWSF